MDQLALKKGTRFKALDSLQGFAAISVFLFHCALGHSSEAKRVDLFFIISGFVISSPFSVQMTGNHLLLDDLPNCIRCIG